MIRMLQRVRSENTQANPGEYFRLRSGRKEKGRASRRRGTCDLILEDGQDFLSGSITKFRAAGSILSKGIRMAKRACFLSHRSGPCFAHRSRFHAADRVAWNAVLQEYRLLAFPATPGRTLFLSVSKMGKLRL